MNRLVPPDEFARDLVQITFGTPVAGLRPGDIITMPGVPLRGWRRFVAWLRRQPLETGTRTFVVRSTL